MALDDAALARIRPFCSDVDKDVFALFGLPEEVIAVLFAYYSRSKDDLRTNLAKLLEQDELDVTHAGSARASSQAGGHSAAEEKARSFHEKWVVGYGHASVAEHACVHLAVERVSILCAKAIEDLRLASYTEKSTRYVQFSHDSFVTPSELTGALRTLHEETSRALFDTYLGLFPKTEAALRARIPRGEKQSEKGYATAIHAQACDLLRGLLPAGTRTNLGFTANARSLAMLLCKMLASPIAEVRDVASAMHEASKSVSPTLVKYVAADAHRASVRDAIAPKLREGTEPAARPDRNHARFVAGDDARDALRKIALALAYEHAFDVDAGSLSEMLATADEDRLGAIVGEALSTRGRFDQAPRAFEAAHMTAELVLDYGAFRDLQRHRMLTQQVQRLGADLGAEVPAELETLGVAGEVRRALDRAEAAWRTIANEAPDAAQYVVPLAFRVRTLWMLDLRELVHVIELRSARQGHQSYRRMAHDMMRVAEERYPWLAPHVRVDRTPVHALARDEK